jgi:hypothetical protein
VRAAWLSFIRTGTPDTDTGWPRFTRSAPAVRHWGAAHVPFAAEACRHDRKAGS